MSRGRELAKLIVGQSVVVTGVDSDLANTIAALKTRLDSDDAKLQSLGNSLGGNTASLRADLDSDSAVIQTLRTNLTSEISATNTDIAEIKTRLDSEHENTRSIIAAGLVNLADSVICTCVSSSNVISSVPAPVRRLSNISTPTPLTPLRVISLRVILAGSCSCCEIVPIAPIAIWGIAMSKTTSNFFIMLLDIDTITRNYVYLFLLE